MKTVKAFAAKDATTPLAPLPSKDKSPDLMMYPLKLSSVGMSYGYSLCSK